MKMGFLGTKLKICEGFFFGGGGGGFESLVGITTSSKTGLYPSHSLFKTGGKGKECNTPL